MKHRSWENVARINDLDRGVTPISWALQWERPKPDLADLLAARDPDHPHLLAIWEPLLTNAPSPMLVRPYCCLIRTVIFYDVAYRKRPWGKPWRRGGGWGWTEPGGLLEWDKVETRLTHGDVVAFDGDHWLIGGGQVRWHRRRWWMRRLARRREKPALRLVA